MPAQAHPVTSATALEKIFLHQIVKEHCPVFVTQLAVEYYEAAGTNSHVAMHCTSGPCTADIFQAKVANDTNESFASGLKDTDTTNMVRAAVISDDPVPCLINQAVADQRD